MIIPLRLGLSELPYPVNNGPQFLVMGDGKVIRGGFALGLFYTAQRIVEGMKLVVQIVQ